MDKKTENKPKYRYADLHCHANMRSYFWVGIHRKDESVSPWNIVSSNIFRLKNIKRAAGFSQCDLAMLWNGGGRLIFNSLYPIETGFFKAPKKPSKGKNQFARRALGTIMHHKGPARRLLQTMIMRIPSKTIKRILAPEYSYWEALQDEYAFVKIADGKTLQTQIHTPGVLRKLVENAERRRRRFPNILDANGMYKIPKNKAELKECLDGERDILTMVLTVEGAHAIGVDTGDEATLLKRIDTIKQEWEHPLFFMTFAHHFYNQLCGHANSLPGMAKYVMNQDKGMNEGFAPMGWAVLRKLLALDANNERLDEYRILIDTKHMSVKARKEWYDEVIRPCLAKGDVIPVISSHSAYSGVKTLDEMIENAPHEHDHMRMETDDGMFYGWNINLCDEDIEMMYETGGLFGVSFDVRMLGLSAKKSEQKREDQNNIKAIWKNMKAILHVICKNDKYSKAEKQRAWDMIMIGTDFDGYIEPIETYKTALDFDQMRADLMAVMKEDAASPNPPVCLQILDDTLTIERVVEKFCFENAREFVLKHYPDKA